MGGWTRREWRVGVRGGGRWEDDEEGVEGV